MKNPFKKLFSKHKEDLVLVYLNDLPFLTESFEVQEDELGNRFIIAVAAYDVLAKKWCFYKKKTKKYVDAFKIRYMKNNILIKYNK